MVLWLCSLPWETPPRHAWPVAEDWAEGMVSWAVVLAAAAAAAAASSLGNQTQ